MKKVVVVLLMLMSLPSWADSYSLQESRTGKKLHILNPEVLKPFEDVMGRVDEESNYECEAYSFRKQKIFRCDMGLSGILENVVDQDCALAEARHLEPGEFIEVYKAQPDYAMYFYIKADSAQQAMQYAHSSFRQVARQDHEDTIWPIINMYHPQEYDVICTERPEWIQWFEQW